MIRNTKETVTFIPFLAISLLINMAIFAYFLSKIEQKERVVVSDNSSFIKKDRIMIDQIKLESTEELKKMKSVGIKNGAKNSNQPDLVIDQRPTQLMLSPEIGSPENKAIQPSSTKTVLNSLKNNDNVDSHFFIDSNASQIKVTSSPEQDNIKKQALSNLNGVPSNKVQKALSGLEVRMERPEGVSENELNDIEKMYYSFNVRMYKTFYTTILSNFEKIKIQKPGLERALAFKHELLGKVDYDENGDIVSIKILKSSDSDDVHYFFEESLKMLKLPNPPKSKLGKSNSFSIYYLITIN